MAIRHAERVARPMNDASAECTRNSMQLFPTLQHRHKVCDPLAARFSFFGGGDAEEEAVALGFVEGCEERFGIGFSLMCLNVKEGQYPAPPPPDSAGVGPGSFLRATAGYFE